MCGISGIIGECSNRNEILSNMMKRMYHRGPDSSGVYKDDHAALGFRRLSIVDLDHGHQPMYNEERSLVIVFNGEVYNYAGLREILQQKGHKFANQSDTETLIHGYEEYGTDLLKKIQGMFAFAIWDKKSETLFAARDFFGIKPFYYALIDNTLIFASEIKSILEYPGYEKKVNEKALEQYLSFQYSPLEETFFNGIYKLLPGYSLTYKNGSLKIKRYWRPDLKPEKRLPLSQAVSKISDVTLDSIKRHLTGDVEIGAFLSSGVDSSYIARHFGGKKTFTVGFSEDNGRYNEIPYAKKLAETINVDNYHKEISAEEFWGIVPNVMYHMDEPLADASAIALYFVNQEAAKQVKVALSGEGVDELFGGYRIYKEAIDLAWFKLLPGGMRRGIRKIGDRLPKMKGKNYLIRGSKTLQERFIGNANIYTAEEKNKLLKSAHQEVTPQDVTTTYYEECKQLDDVSKMQYIDMNLWLPGDILLKADKMSMAHSLELRVPYLDLEVFQVARRLPVSLKIKKKMTKYAFRKNAEAYIPDNVAYKKKLGFPVPIRVWLKQDKYYNQVKQAFQSQYAGQYFDQKYLMKLLEDHRNGIEDNSRKIWVVYTFLVWFDVFFVSNKYQHGQ